MEIIVDTEYFAGCRNHVELEGVDSWDQIKGWYVKWGCFFCTLDNENWKEVDMVEEVGNCVDTKRPVHVQVLDPETEEHLDGDEL
jgi:hypothetical protein